MVAIGVTAVVGALLWAWPYPGPARGAPPYTHKLTLSMTFKDMGGGGDAEFAMKFSSEKLCKSVRRAIWSQLQDADGDLGECESIWTSTGK